MSSNKETVLEWLKIVSVFLLAFIVLIPNVEIWNLAANKLTDGFHVVVSILNLIFGGAAVYFYQKKVGAFAGLKRKDKDETSGK